MAKYKIKIDREVCVGDRACTEEAPDTFAIDDEGKSVVTNPDGDPPEHILGAAKSCPFEGISLYDVETGKQVWPKT